MRKDGQFNIVINYRSLELNFSQFSPSLQLQFYYEQLEQDTLD